MFPKLGKIQAKFLLQMEKSWIFKETFTLAIPVSFTWYLHAKQPIVQWVVILFVFVLDNSLFFVSDERGLGYFLPCFFFSKVETDILSYVHFLLIILIRIHVQMWDFVSAQFNTSILKLSRCNSLKCWKSGNDNKPTFMSFWWLHDYKTNDTYSFPKFWILIVKIFHATQHTKNCGSMHMCQLYFVLKNLRYSH